MEVMISCIKYWVKRKLFPTLWYRRGGINTSDVSNYNCGYSSNDTWWPDAF